MDQPNPRAYHLRKKENPGEGVRRIVLGRTDRALEGLRRANTGNEPATEVHDVRKELKKIRSALRLVRTGLGDKRFKSLNRLYRDAGRELSGARDAQVKAETLEALIDQFGDDMPGEETMAWREHLAGEGVTAAANMKEDRTPIVEAIGHLEKARDKLAGKPIKAKRSDLFDGLDESYVSGREAMGVAAEDPSDENFHQWRKRAKDLWYQQRIVKKSWEPMIAEAADAAHELADYLGDHHDLAVLAEDLATRDIAAGEKSEIQAVIDRRQEQLADSAFDLGARIYAEKPKAFDRRMRSYWEAWR